MILPRLRFPVYELQFPISYMGRMEAEMATRASRPNLVISITDPDTEDARVYGDEVVRLQFLDVSDPELGSSLGLPVPSACIVGAILDALERSDPRAQILCHCEAGISRSFAVAIMAWHFVHGFSGHDAVMQAARTRNPAVRDHLCANSAVLGIADQMMGSSLLSAAKSAGYSA